MKIRTERKGRESRVRKIKWWRLNEPEVRNQFKGKVMEDGLMQNSTRLVDSK
jgi:hypothetical protein